MHTAYKIISRITMLTGIAIMVYLCFIFEGSIWFPMYIIGGVCAAGLIFAIIYGLGPWKKAITSQKHQARLAKQIAERPEPPFLRPAGCSTYMAGRMKALYPDGEVLENGSFILRFKGGRSAAYYAPRVSELGVWPSLEKYYYQCCDYCGDKAHKQCDRCGREQDLYITLKKYFDSIVEERRVHVLGVNIYGEERGNGTWCEEPEKRAKLAGNAMYGVQANPRTFGSDAMFSAIFPDDLAAYAETRSYLGTYDRVVQTVNRGGPVLEYTPWVWPETEESEQPDSEKGH